ncbi:MAG TPA: SatD family protein [Clostridiaceae bacterium]
MLYTAFIADIVNSKKLLKEEREQIQVFIKKCLGTLNNIFKSSLEFDVTFSAGDEVQGLFKTPTAAFLYLRIFKLIISPLQIRAGIGIGEWDVRIISGTSNEQDGSAYHNARTAILYAHDRNDYSILFNSNNSNNIYINTLINTSLLFVKNQSQYQNQVLLLTELMNPLFDNNSMDSLAFAQIFLLVQKKVEQKFYINANNKLKNNISLFNNIPVSFEPLYIFSSTIFKDKFALTSTLKKGLSAMLSHITNTSRQNIDNVIKAGNISEIRNIDVTTLLLIYKNFEVNA